MPTASSRRSPGAGGVEVLPSGTFRARLRVPSKGRITLGTYATAAEAQEVLDAALAQLAEAQLAPTGAFTLRQWGARWIPERKAAGVHRDHQVVEALWKARILSAPFIDLALRDLRPEVLQAWLRSLATAPARWRRKKGQKTDNLRGRALYPDSVRRIHSVLRACLEAAVEARLIPSNPARGLRVRLPERPDDEPWTYLTPEEVRRVQTSEAIPAEARVIFVAAIFTGLRRGELWGLRWSDLRLDGDHPEVHVQRSYNLAPKTRRSRRHVPLLPAAVEALAWWKDRCPTGEKNPEGLVFPGPSGAMRGRWDDARWTSDPNPGAPTKGHAERAGITRRVRFYDLRHTCASHLVMGTWGRAWRLEEVRDLLGHTSISTTLRYAHLSPDHLRGAAAATRGAVGPEGGGGWPTKPVTTENKREKQAANHSLA